MALEKIKVVKLYSTEQKAVVGFDVATVTEEDEGGNKSTAIVVSHGKEIHKFSPSITDSELLGQIELMNKELQEVK